MTDQHYDLAYEVKMEQAIREFQEWERTSKLERKRLGGRPAKSLLVGKGKPRKRSTDDDE